MKPLNLDGDDEPEHPPVAPAPADSPEQNSPEAETCLLGACFLDAEVVDKCERVGLQPSDFFDKRRAMVYQSIRTLHKRREPVETATVHEELRSRKCLRAVGGMPFLIEVSKATPTQAEAEFHLRTVRDKAALRELVRIGRMASEANGNAGELLEEFRRKVSQPDVPTGPRHLTARSFSDFELPPPNDPSVLLGNRFLSRGDVAILASTSGMGKSSLSVQAAVTWALGRPLFGGLRPNGPLRSLFFQSEDNDGDIAEVRLSLIHAMKLGPEEIAQVGDRVKIVTDRVNRGLSFRDELKRQIALHKPDLVWINPLLAFIDGDVNDAQSVGVFVRQQLNSLNEPPTHAYVIVHHTAKPPKEAQGRRWNEVMYEMAGSADLTNSARAIMSLKAMPEEGKFNLILAKRGRRAGFTEDVPSERTPGLSHTQPATTIGLKHSGERIPMPGYPNGMPLIYWERTTPTKEDQKPTGPRKRPSAFTLQSLWDFIPGPSSPAIAHAALARYAKTLGMPDAEFKGMMAEVSTDGRVERITHPALGFSYRRPL